MRGSVRLLAGMDALGGMQCGQLAGGPHASLIGSWVGDGKGIQEGKIHAQDAPPDNMARSDAPACV